MLSVALALTALVLVGPASASANGGTPCGIPGAVVAHASPTALVVRGRGEMRRYWACLWGGRAVYIGMAGQDRGGELVLEDFTAAGPFLAVVGYDCLAECAPPRVHVFDLRTGRRVRSVYASPTGPPLLGTRGGLVSVESYGMNRRRIQVWDSRGTRIVVRGPRRDLPRRAVRVDGNILRWTDAGIRHSFRLR